MLYKTILALKKFGDTLFGNSRSWKRSQGQAPKKFLKKIYGEFEILGKFPLRIWFCVSQKILYQMTLNCMDPLF